MGGDVTAAMAHARGGHSLSPADTPILPTPPRRRHLVGPPPPRNCPRLLFPRTERADLFSRIDSDFCRRGRRRRRRRTRRDARRGSERGRRGGERIWLAQGGTRPELSLRSDSLMSPWLRMRPAAGTIGRRDDVTRPAPRRPLTPQCPTDIRRDCRRPGDPPTPNTRHES